MLKIYIRPMKKLLIIFLLHSKLSISQVAVSVGVIDNSSTAVILPNQFRDYVNYLQDSDLTKFTKKWIGVPYRFGGRTSRGIDCSQFSKRLYRDVYKKDLPNVCQKQWLATQRVERDSLQVGDLVFFKSRRSPSGWHCGVYLGEDRFIHSPGRRSCVKISNLREEHYKRNYKGAGRI